ncbi:membrane protein insertase YidC [Pseudomonas sp. SK3(2021)]|uniref:membrane protein insertase YidC n=1 Tax=Pseudomonas sp. SK3(2021) TaxID=2841064 RepID=UPI00192BDEC0|nr:membrane protein insertase YidC [Pseudomonas sp. SK3(2021)]QQZ42191.1 membrane protein insertase YidC [Pseudomonas sp. SK3(2021)]
MLIPIPKNVHQCKWLAWLLLFIPLAGAADPKFVTLTNSSLQLEFNLSTGAVSHWFLPQLHGAEGKNQDMAAPKGQLFLLSGALAGRDLREWEQQAGGWKVLEQRPDVVVLGLEGDDVPFSLKKTWHLLDHDWRADFTLDLDFKDLKRTSQDHLELAVGPGIGETPAVGLGMGQSIYSYTELAYHGPEGVKTLRLNNADMPEGYDSQQAGQWDWVGLQSRYLALILAPANDLAQGSPWRAVTPEGNAEHVAFDTSVNIALPVADTGKGQIQAYVWHVFSGGKAYTALTAQAPDLNGLLFSGLWNWMRALSLGIMHVLHFIQQLVGSWGIAIILLAVLVRVLVYPIARNAISAQKKFAAIQARIQPELQAIRKNYKGGEQSERILQIYESHNVSPLAGLKPLLIVLVQVPIFVSLYHLLGQTFELRDASFLWMNTLAEPDQLFALGMDLPLFGAYFNLLPVLMALTTLLSIKLNPTPVSDGKSGHRQAAMSGLMGLGFFLLFYSFPSGMVLYWTVANILQVVHQKLAKVG